ncbi:hypothetical protein AAF712_006314 [Marasmius tenuissimus]|uniref:GST N-terminal domain-containing protein n=1 Tax=Marasmius tenuissimus TaxID=585030 RepID=A0ABR2ZZZ7_9AGAR|nr:hypothetical protein PM082_021742 [Marasmius tenuissimus]
MITLYDFGPSIDKSMGMSPFVRSIRFALNYKGIPYTSIEVNLSELESTAKSIGAAPTMNYIDGSAKYTVPMIQDSTTGRVVSDSFKIAEYLDETYPDTPRVIPAGTRMLQSTFCSSVFLNLQPLMPIIQPVAVAKFLPPEVAESYKKLFGEEALKLTLSAEEQAEIWTKVVQWFRLMAQGYGDRASDDSPFVMGGEKPTFADMFTAGLLWWIKLAFEDTQAWKDIVAMGDGKIGRLLEETLVICAKK